MSSKTRSVHPNIILSAIPSYHVVNFWADLLYLAALAILPINTS